MNKSRPNPTPQGDSVLAPSSRRQWLKTGGAALLTGVMLSRSRAFAGPQPAPAAPAGPAPRPISLALNENPFGPSPRALAAIQADLAGLHRYTGDEAAALAHQIAAFENVAPEQILLGEVLEPLGLHLGLQGGPGAEYVYSVPGYPALVDAAGRVGGVVVPVPLNDNLENDLPALAARVNARTKAVFLVNPHNPSGTVSPAAEFTAFAEAVSKRALVVVDEAYLEFCDDFRGRTAANLTRAGANVIVFRTFSKAHGLAALAFGYAVAPRPLADFLRSRGVGFARDLNRLSIAAASGSLSDPAQIDRVRLLVTDERNAWHNDLNALGLRHTAAAGNFVYFDAGRPADEVAAAFAREGIVIGRVFPPYNTWVRISIGLPEENARARAVARRLLTSHI